MRHIFSISEVETGYLTDTVLEVTEIETCHFVKLEQCLSVVKILISTAELMCVFVTFLF
jgi:hypothetical protein